MPITLDNSPEAHDAYVAAVKAAIEKIDATLPANAFYVQSFMVAQSGEPESVWRWEDAEFRQTTRSELIAQWRQYEEGGTLHPVAQIIENEDGMCMVTGSPAASVTIVIDWDDLTDDDEYAIDKLGELAKVTIDDAERERIEARIYRIHPHLEGD